MKDKIKRITSIVLIILFLAINISNVAEMSPATASAVTTAHLAPVDVMDDIAEGTIHDRNMELAVIELEMYLRGLHKLAPELDDVCDTRSLNALLEKKLPYVEEKSPPALSAKKSAVKVYFNSFGHLGGHVFYVPVSVTKNGKREDYQLIFSTRRYDGEDYRIVPYTRDEFAGLGEFFRSLAAREMLPARSKRDTDATRSQMHRDDSGTSEGDDEWLSEEWRPIEGIVMDKPFDSKVQDKCAEILRRTELAENTGYSFGPKSLYKICCALLFVRCDYKAVIKRCMKYGHLSWLRDHFWLNANMAPVYLAARMMDAESVQEVIVAKEPFFAFHLKKLFGANSLTAVLYESQGTIMARMSTIVFKFINAYRKAGEYRKARDLLDNFILIVKNEPELDEAERQRKIGKAEEMRRGISDEWLESERLSSGSKQPRDPENGQFREKPGRNADGAAMVIFRSPHVIGQIRDLGFFRFEDYRRGYEQVAGEFGFAKLPEDPDNDKQSRQDLEELAGKGLLSIARQGRKNFYILTDKGHQAIRQLQLTYGVDVKDFLKPPGRNILLRQAQLLVPEDYSERPIESKDVFNGLGVTVKGEGLSAKKSALIFSEKVTFEHGLGILLPKLAKEGIRVAVIGKGPMQESIIDELNKDLPAGRKIICARSVEFATAALTISQRDLERYYYFKVNGDPEETGFGVTTFDITNIVDKIIKALGAVCDITDGKLLELMNQATQKFKQAA